MKVILFLLLMIYTSCCNSPNEADTSHMPSKQSLANEVRNQTFAQLKMEKELYPCGVGSGMMNQIKMLALAFNYYKDADIEHARELLMAGATLFLNKINSNEQIRPYLDNYPFRPENIQIIIYLQTPIGSPPDFGKLIVVSMSDGILRYSIENSKTGPLITIHEETYEEASEKLHSAASI